MDQSKLVPTSLQLALHGKLDNTWFTWLFGANILGAEHATSAAGKARPRLGTNDLTAELSEFGVTLFGAN
jgi:hypothetical protein